MTFKPMFALHKDGGGSVLAANDFTHEYQLSTWLRGLSFQPGDTVEFREVAVRSEFAEVEEPLIKAEEPLAPPPTEKPILADDPF